jgi:hypothetical protein
MVATAVESMSAFQHTDAPFAADAPPLSPTEPALVFVRAPSGRLRATTRQHHSADAAVRRGVFVGGRPERTPTTRADRRDPAARAGGHPRGADRTFARRQLLLRAADLIVAAQHFFITQPHYLKWMLKLKEVEMRK